MKTCRHPLPCLCPVIVTRGRRKQLQIEPRGGRGRGRLDPPLGSSSSSVVASEVDFYFLSNQLTSSIVISHTHSSRLSVSTLSRLRQLSEKTA